MEKLLTQKTILITGGTSRLGNEFVLKAIEQGAHIFFTYHKNKPAAETLIQKGAKGFELDLSDTKSIEEFSKFFKTQVKQLDVLIHNAAAVRDHTLHNLTEEEWDLVLSVNLKAPFYLTKKLLSLLFKKEYSKIFMLTSRVAVTGAFGISNYAAAKAGLIGLTKSMAQELGRKKILVNAINPGFMKSAMTEQLPEQVIETNLQASPIEQFSDPAEVADFLVYLSSDKMSQVTGQVIHFESRKI